MDAIIVCINGIEREWPRAEYLDIKASQLGFEDYEDMKKQGYHLAEENDI